MGTALAGAAVLLFFPLGGCSVPGTAEDFAWSLEVPKSVDKGADLVFRVLTHNAAKEPVDGVKYHYQILWTGGSSNPLRHTGRTGEDERIRSRLAAGPATLVVTCVNRSGNLIKVGEAGFEVK